VTPATVSTKPIRQAVPASTAIKQRTRSESKPRIVLSARIDPKVVDKLERISKRKGHRNLSDTVETAIRDYINEYEEAK